MWIEIGGRGTGAGIRKVTPRAGVWIEIKIDAMKFFSPGVTPRAGVWIEMCLVTDQITLEESLPVRECGLKCPLPLLCR